VFIHVWSGARKTEDRGPRTAGRLKRATSDKCQVTRKTHVSCQLVVRSCDPGYTFLSASFVLFGSRGSRCGQRGVGAHPSESACTRASFSRVYYFGTSDGGGNCLLTTSAIFSEDMPFHCSSSGYTVSLVVFSVNRSTSATNPTTPGDRSTYSG